MKRLGLALLIAGAALAMPLAWAHAAHARTSEPPAFGALISAINHTGEAAGLINAIPSGTPTYVVLVDAGGLLKGNNVHALDNALARNSSDIGLLQGALGTLTVHPPDPCLSQIDGNASCGTSFGQFLSTQKVLSSDVIAVVQGIPGSDGSPSITVFFFHPPNPCTESCPGS